MSAQQLCGVYSITHVETGHCYVGSSCNITARWQYHRRTLRRRRHENKRLENAWHKYGATAFSFVVLEETEEAMLLDRERYYVDLLQPYFNIQREPVARPPSWLGKRHRPETIAKIRASAQGNKYSAGAVCTEERREQLRRSSTGRRFSDESRAKMSRSAKERAARIGHVGAPDRPRLNVAVTYQGRTQKLDAWARELGLSYSTLQYCIKHGMSAEDAVARPAHPGKRLTNDGAEQCLSS